LIVIHFEFGLVFLSLTSSVGKTHSDIGWLRRCVVMSIGIIVQSARNRRGQIVSVESIHGARSRFRNRTTVEAIGDGSAVKSGVRIDTLWSRNMRRK